jgi:DNA-binding transcriptional regulator YiaG
MQDEKARTNAEVVSRVCYDCGGEMEGRRGSEYNYTESGLQKVWLQNILVFRCKNPQCHAIVPEIPNMAELHVVIAMKLIAKPTLLSGEEIKFLRQMANLGSSQMAAMLGIHVTQLSRWENDKRIVSKKSDVALRLFCIAFILQERVRNTDIVPKFRELTERLSHMDLTKILEGVREIMKGSRPVVLDPERLSEFGGAELEGMELAGSIQ